VKALLIVSVGLSGRLNAQQVSAVSVIFSPFSPAGFQIRKYFRIFAR